MSMRAGQYNTLVTIEKADLESDKYGQRIESWKPWPTPQTAERWASIEPQSGREIEKGTVLESVARYLISIRYDPSIADLNGRMRFRYTLDGRESILYLITRMWNPRRKGNIETICMETDPRDTDADEN